MLTHIRPAITTAILLVMAGPLAAVDDPLSRSQMVKLGKRATALLQITGRNGSAFCVHPSGLFVSNEHVLRQSGNSPATATLILDAGLKTQKKMTAKVVRRDAELDLVLLRVGGEDKFPALTLGSDQELDELAELIAFGFPFGVALGKEGAYPAISVTTGRVNSLRRDKNGDLYRIQLDAVLNPGNSGGPVLDKDGKVVGVVVSGIVGAGINMAIPVSHLQRFLARPDLAFIPPVVNRGNQHEPAEFRARATSVLPTATPLDLELVLATFGAPARRQPMKLVDDGYVVKTVPFVAPQGPPTCDVEVKYEDGLVTGRATDREFKLGQQAIKLSDLSSLHLGPKAKIQLNSGKVLEGSLSELESLLVKVGEQSLRLELAAAKEIKVTGPGDGSAVSCIIVARQAGKEVGRLSEPLYLEGASQASLDAIRDGRFIKPARSVAPVSYLRAVSSKGDFIGQGKSYSYNREDMVVQRADRGVQLTVGGFAGWRILFGAPRGQFLQVGQYFDAKRYPFSDDAPGIEFTGFGRGANKIAGKFVVWEFEVKGNDIVRLAIDFIQHSEITMPPLYGMIRFNSSFH